MGSLIVCMTREQSIKEKFKEAMDSFIVEIRENNKLLQESNLLYRKYFEYRYGGSKFMKFLYQYEFLIVLLVVVLPVLIYVLIRGCR